MNNVSSNDVSSNDVSGNDKVNESVSDNEEYQATSEYIVYNSIDYTQNFENIQTLLILICALLVAYGVAFAFFKGFKR